MTAPTLAAVERRPVRTGGRPLASFGAVAEDYARRGWHVFPLRGKGQQLIRSWAREATTDVEQIREWDRRWPDANIGIACGPSRLVVVDLDGDAGSETWERLTVTHDIESSPLVSITGSGGRHIVYQLPDGVHLGNTQKRLGPGIDTRGEGGYFIVPPSIHPNGKDYRWLDRAAEPLPCPSALIELLACEPEQPDPWAPQALSLAAIRQPRPPVAWVLDGVLARRSVNLLYGPPGGFKTMVGAALAACVAGGQRFLASSDGSGGLAVVQGPVTWLDFDSGEDVTVERLAAFAAAHGLPEDAPITAYCSPNPAFDASDPLSVAALIERCQGTALIVIDTLTHIKGGIDSNSDDMTAVMTGLRELAERTGAAVLVLHHQRKAQVGGHAREGDSIRGSSAIEAGLDTALMVQRDGRRVTIRSTKSRRGEIPTLHAEFTFEHAADGKALASARFWPVAGPSEQAFGAIADRVVDALRQRGELSTNQLEDSVGGNKGQLSQVLEQLVARGSVAVRKGSRNAKVYSIPTGD